MVDPVLFRVLYGAGLKVSEAHNLNLTDVDTRSGTLRIRDSKNSQSRTVPVTGRLTAIPKATSRPRTLFEPVPRLRSVITGSSRTPSGFARRTRPVW